MKEISPFHEPARLFVRWGVLDNRSLSWCRYFVWGAAWFLGSLGEMVITIALGAFAISSLAMKLPVTVKLIPFLMVPFYFVGWSADPESISVARLDVVNLPAAFYGLLWIPLGYAVWDY